MSIPRRIHLLWLQGWDNAPELAQVCADAWQRMNPEYEIVRHDAASLPSYLGEWDIPYQDLPPQALSDVFRLSVLRRDGGVWADASLVPILPLRDWLEQAGDTGLYLAGSWREDRAFSSWFIAASPQNPLIDGLCELAKAYWCPKRKSLLDVLISGTGTYRVPARALRLRYKLGLFRLPDDPIDCVRPDGPRRWHHVFPYFWIHYLFGYLVASDPALRRLWDEAPKLDTMAAQWMAWHLKSDPNAPVSDFIAARGRAPVQKLRFKRSLPADRQIEIARALTQDLR